MSSCTPLIGSIAVGMTSSGEVRKMNFVLGRDCSGSPARAARWKAALITGPSVSGSCTKTLASSAKEREVGAGSPEGRAKLGDGRR